MKKLICLIVLCLVVGAVLAGIPCPVHNNSNGVFTGNTQISDNGKRLKEYRCPRGHTFWVVS